MMGIIARVLSLQKEERNIISEKELTSTGQKLTALRNNIKLITSSQYSPIVNRYTDLLNDIRTHRVILEDLKEKKRQEASTSQDEKKKARISIARITEKLMESESRLRIRLLSIGVALDNLGKVEKDIANSAREVLTPVFIKLGYEVELSQSKINALIRQ